MVVVEKEGEGTTTVCVNGSFLKMEQREGVGVRDPCGCEHQASLHTGRRRGSLDQGIVVSLQEA